MPPTKSKRKRNVQKLAPSLGKEPSFSGAAPSQASGAKLASRSLSLTLGMAMTDQISIWTFDSFEEFLVVKCKHLAESNSRFSLRWLAKRINSKSYSTLSSIMNGDRLASRDLINKFSKLFSLTPAELQYALVLHDYVRAEEPIVRETLLSLIKEMQKNSRPNLPV